MKHSYSHQVYRKAFCAGKKQDMFSYPENLKLKPFANALTWGKGSQVAFNN
jgi:hypothetical protein